MTTPTPHLKMILFTSKDCGVCAVVKKNVLPVLKKKHPNIQIEEVVIGLEGPGDDDRAETRADAYGVKSVPAIFFEVAGLPVGDGTHCTLNGLAALWAEAEAALKEVAGAP